MSTTNLTCDFPIPPALNLGDGQSACGVQGAAENLHTCCGTTNTNVTGGCWQWCVYNGTLPDFAACVSSGSLRTDAFCQSKVNGTLDDSIACLSSGAKGAAGDHVRPLQKTTSLLALLLIVGIFTSGAMAESLPEVCGSQFGPFRLSCVDSSQTCTSFEPTTSLYNKIGQAVAVSNATSCDSTSPCSTQVRVHHDSAYCANASLIDDYCGVVFSRTLRAADACAEPCDANYGAIDASDGAFDPLFNVIALRLNQEPGACDGGARWYFDSRAYFLSYYDYWMAAGTSSYLTVAPLLLCQRGTVNNCTGNVLANISSSIVESGNEIEACQMVYLDEAARRAKRYSKGESIPTVLYNQVLVN